MKKKKNWVSASRVLWPLVFFTLHIAYGEECFPTSMPDMIEASSGGGNDYFYAITGSSTVLFYGGYTTSPGLTSQSIAKAGIVAAVNSETNARLWARIFDAGGDTAKFVSGLAYNSHTNRVAVYAQTGGSGSEGTKEID